MADADKSPGERSRTDEELRLLYQVTIQDLVFFKQQQWSITSYVLLLDTAIIGIPQLPKTDISTCERLLLCILATGLTLAGVYLLWKLEMSIKARRGRLKNIRRLFTKTFCLVWRSEHKAADSPAIAILLGVIIIVGAGIIWWLVYAKASIAT